MNILDEIAEKTRERIAEKAKEIPLSEVREAAEKLPKTSDFPFKKALSGEDIAFICEVKRASPSKGIIAQDFPYLQI
ncbi:MAG: indole-3-glycerol-phosphate synthase TrpC, partial [Oscillospiraceae bacterium]